VRLLGSCLWHFPACLCVFTLPVYPQAAPSLNVGFYHWGGVYPASISQGVDGIAAIGGHVTRIVISARMNIDYQLGSSCIAGFTLAGAAQDSDVKKAFDNPAINTFMLTAYDGVTWGDCGTHQYLNPRFYTPSNTEAIIQEYSDFTLYLSQAYQHTGKRFIISNWESDNDVYCGAAYSYATDSSFRAYCDQAYPQIYAGNSGPSESFLGLKRWFEVRQKGIEDGRRRALARGIGGKRVYFAPEFNICRCLQNAEFKSTLYSVIPYIKFDYVSYSSYQSVNMPEPEVALLQDLETIETVAGSRDIIIGEILTGTPENDPQAFTRILETVMNAALSWGVPYLIYWSEYSPYNCAGCGLHDAAGQITVVGQFFKDYLPGNTLCTPAINGSTAFARRRQ